MVYYIDLFTICIIMIKETQGNGLMHDRIQR